MTAQAVLALKAVGTTIEIPLEIKNRMVGGAAIEAEGLPISRETMTCCTESDAILFGAVGGPANESFSTDGVRPEQALFRLRREFDFYANLRPITPLRCLLPGSPIRETLLSRVDIMFVRELSAGLYYGYAESTEEKPSEVREVDGTLEAIDTLLYTEPQIERVARTAFEIARQRRQKLTSVDKANVLSSSVLWRGVIDEVAGEYPDVEHEHMLVDASAMRLVSCPRQFGVIVTENLFGDILTDEASALVGSLGMLPSASLSKRTTPRGHFGLYEPVHGSAPEIAGKDVANPIGSILSAAMLLRHSLGRPEAARVIERSVSKVLEAGYRTADIAVPGSKVVGTQEMGGRICDQILRESASPSNGEQSEEHR